MILNHFLTDHTKAEKCINFSKNLFTFISQVFFYNFWSPTFPIQLINEEQQQQQQQQHRLQSLNNKENTKANALSGGGGHNNNSSGSVASLDTHIVAEAGDNHKKLAKKKKTSHQPTTSSLALPVLNAKQPQMNAEKQQQQESNSSEECIIIDMEKHVPAQAPSQAVAVSPAIPANLPTQLAELTTHLVGTFKSQNLEVHNVWPNEFKLKLSAVYAASLSLSQSDRHGFYNYLAAKLGKTKDNLVRLMRRIYKQV